MLDIENKAAHVYLNMSLKKPWRWQRSCIPFIREAADQYLLSFMLMRFRGRTSCVRLNINEGILYREDGVNRKRLRLHIYCMSFGRWESNDINLDGVHPPLWPSFFFPSACSGSVGKDFPSWDELYCSWRGNKHHFQGALSLDGILGDGVINHWKIKRSEFCTFGHCQTSRHGKGLWERNLGRV